MNIIKEQKGMALATVLIIVFILAILGTTIWHYSIRDVADAHRAEKKMQAYYLAKSGADAVAQYIITNPDNIDMAKYIDSLTTAPESNPVELDKETPGSFKVKVSREDDDIFIISSTGIVDNVKESMRLRLLQKKAAPLPDVALFASSNIYMDGSPEIIGDVATKANQPGSIYFPWSASISGNLAMDPNADIDKVITGARPNPKDNITGEIKKMNTLSPYELPKFPDFPSDIPNKDSFKAGWNPSPPYHIYDNGRYTDITVKSELVIHIGDQDRIIVVDNLIVNGSGKITLRKTGKGILHLYVGNNLHILNSGKVNYQGQPSDVLLYYKGKDIINLGGDTTFVGCAYLEKADIKIGNSGGITGHIITGGKNIEISGAASAHVKAIYAPHAHVKMTGSGSLRGALICDSFEATGSARLTFDESIMDTFPHIIGDDVGGGVSYEKGQWQ